jgi:beta-N-acetylhexosaminidase
VVVVRDTHRQSWQRDALIDIARDRPDVIVVEMGWPGPERLPGRTCITTYGAARVSADVVAELLGRTREPECVGTAPEGGD